LLVVVCCVCVCLFYSLFNGAGDSGTDTWHWRRAILYMGHWTWVRWRRLLLRLLLADRAIMMRLRLRCCSAAAAACRGWLTAATAAIMMRLRLRCCSAAADAAAAARRGCGCGCRCGRACVRRVEEFPLH
jgi:hypothetical protein